MNRHCPQELMLPVLELTKGYHRNPTIFWRWYKSQWSSKWAPKLGAIFMAILAPFFKFRTKICQAPPSQGLKFWSELPLSSRHRFSHWDLTHTKGAKSLHTILDFQAYNDKSLLLADNNTDKRLPVNLQHQKIIAFATSSSNVHARTRPWVRPKHLEILSKLVPKLQGTRQLHGSSALPAQLSESWPHDIVQLWMTFQVIQSSI